MRSRAATVALIVALGVGLVLRLVWPLADPAPGLSWSGAVFTDPAAIVLAASDAIRTGEWPGSRDQLVYPLFNGITWIAFRCVGPDRLASQILAAFLSIVGVLLLSLSVRRVHGPVAGVVAAAVLGLSFWSGMFARVPLVEHLTTALLSGAVLALVRGGRRAEAAAAGLVAVAMFFGKAHSAPFLPAMLLLVAMRARSVRATFVPLGVVAGVGLAWTVGVFLPHRADLLDQLVRAGDASLEGSGPLAPFTMVSTSWVFHRAPVIAVLGWLFVLETILVPDVRRRRVQDGTAILAFAFVAFWLYVSVLPYRAPRYLIPAIAFLAAGAVVLGVERWKDGVPAASPVRRRVLAGAMTFGVVLGLAAASLHLASAWDAWIRQATLEESRVASWMIRVAGPGPRLTAVAAFLAGIVACLPGSARRKALAPLPRRRALAALTVLCLTLSAGQWTAWIRGRSHVLESARRAADLILPLDARVQGAFAPALTLGTSRHAVVTYGRERKNEVEPGVTHVILEHPAGDAFLRVLSAREGVLPLAGWSLRHRHVRGLTLFTLGPPATEFEFAVGDLVSGRPAEAAARLARLAPSRMPEIASLQAVSLDASGDRAGARRSLDDATRDGGGSAADLHRSARYAREDGDREGVERAQRLALARDAWDDEARLELRADRELRRP